MTLTLNNQSLSLIAGSDSGNWVLGPLTLGSQSTILNQWILGQTSIVLGSSPVIVDLPIHGNDLINVMEYFGDPSVPRDVWRRRVSSMQAMKRFGAPVILKHMYNDEDVQNGLAVNSPNFDSEYGQTRNRDPLSHGVGFVGAVRGQMILSSDEWYKNDGTGGIVKSLASPGSGYSHAPKYRGYGPGYLTYAIMPDTSEDVFRMNEGGALIHIQEAKIQMGFFPQINDNDLLITCELNRDYSVKKTYERYEFKQINQISIRGLDRKGRREYGEDFGNRHVIQQEGPQVLLPHKDTVYSVEVDR